MDEIGWIRELTASDLPDSADGEARARARLALLERADPARTPPPNRPRRGRVPRLALAGFLVLGAVTAALIISAGGDNSSKAFAVEPQDGGGLTIKIFSLEDPAGLERALEDAGIPAQVSWLPAQTICRQPHYSASRVRTPLGGRIGGASGGGRREFPLTIGIMTTEQFREQRQRYRRGEISSSGSKGMFTLDPNEFRPDQSVVISGSPTPYDGDREGDFTFNFGIAEGPVKPCDPVPALPSGGGPINLSPGGGPPYAPVGDAALSQAAIAADLRRTATVAERSENPIEAPPGPDQFLYMKTRELHLEGWLPKGSETRPAGTKEHPRYFTDRSLGEPDVRDALVPTLKEVWTSPDGKTRERETLGRVNFFSDADQSLWEAAGSPPPFAYDPEEHDVGTDSSGRPVKVFNSRSWRGRNAFSYVANNSHLPTDPEALRLAVENRSGASRPAPPSPADSPRGGGTVERLLEILREPIATPALRGGAFKALAEIPHLGFEREVADAAGRRGDAISWTRERGFGRRIIFDPHTSKILAEAEMILAPPSTHENGVPAGTPFRETAYLRSGIVDSTHESAAKENGGPVATATSANRK